MKLHRKYNSSKILNNRNNLKNFNLNKHTNDQDSDNNTLTIHRAEHVMVSPYQIIENGFISVVNNVIVDVGSNILHTKKVVDHGSGIIMPSLVNAHTHFELSALSGKINFDQGFNGWVKELIKEREQCGVELLKREALRAIESAILTGTSLVGEISTLGITENIFNGSDIGGVWFQEYLGNEIEYIETKVASNAIQIVLSKANLKLFSKGDFKKITVAGHAPHTTSPELLKLLKEQTKKANLPFSIHVAESDGETEFITTGQGGWATFLKERGIDHSNWSIPSRSPVQYLNDIGLLDKLTLAVHLINIDDQDIEIIAKTKTNPILCPRSNFNLHKKLPNIPLFFKYRLKPAIGTDSLASTETLNMFDEMLYLSNNFPQVKPSDIIAMATINGANALGLGKFYGTIEKGKQADFIHIPTKIFSNNIEETIMSVITTNLTY